MPVAPLPYATTSLQPFTHSHFPELRHPRIGLVLSGGGARGMSQIGVLQALEESGIRPDVVVGTSIGSIIGGLYASGYSAATLQSTIKTIDWNALLRLSNRSDREDLLVDQKSISDRSIISIRFDGLRPVIPISVLTGQLLANLLNELTLQAIYHATDFDDLGIPFRAIATDLYTGKRVILDHGSLAEAMRASATVPVLYDAVQRDSMALVDGGLRSNIPVDVARSMGCDIVIAVNTTSPQRTRSQITNPIEALDQVLNVLMERTNAEQLRLADIVITPDLQSTLSTSFDAPDSLIAQGYRAAMRILPDLRRRMQRCVDTLLPRALFAGRQFTVAPDSRPASLRASLGSADDGMALLRKLYASASEDSIANVFVTADSADTSMLHIDGVPYPRIRDVAFGGVRSIRTERLRQSTRAWIGAPVSARSTRRLCEGILHVYRDLGYSLASIDSVGIDTSSGRITVGVNEGEIGRIRVEGNVRTDTIVILRQFPMRGGEIFRIDDAREGLRNITGLNLFHQVSYDIIDTGGRPDVVIRLEERPSQSMHVSMLVNDERNAQLGIELRDANLFGTGTSLSGLFFGGIDNRQYSATYSTSQIFYTPFSLTLRSYYKLTDYNRYADDPGVTGERFARTVESRIRDIRIGGSASVGVYVQRFGMLSGTLRAENQRSRTFEFRQPGAPDLGEHGLVVSLSIGTTIDTQDRYPYPERGILMTAEYTSAQSALGSHVAFTRITAGYDVYIPGPTSRWTFHPRVRFGYGDRTLPRMEEFRLGGLYEFAGMRENEFTGQQLFVGSFETRYLLPVRMLFDTYLSVRYDLGRTWDIPEQIKFGELRHGVLAGLGLDTPIGPADFAVGKSFLFSSSGASSLTRWGPTMLYFSIGIGI